MHMDGECPVKENTPAVGNKLRRELWMPKKTHLYTSLGANNSSSGVIFIISGSRYNPVKSVNDEISMVYRFFWIALVGMGSGWQPFHTLSFNIIFLWKMILKDFKKWQNNFADTKDTESPQCLWEISDSRELGIANTDLCFGNKRTNR